MKNVFVKTEKLLEIPVSKKEIGTQTRLEQTLKERGFNVIPQQFLYYYNWDNVPKENVTIYQNGNKYFVFCGYKQIRKNVEPCVKLKQVLLSNKKIFK